VLGAVALLASVHGVPTTEDVRSAIEDTLNAICGGSLESENCTTHPSSAEVRALSCKSIPVNKARCSYRERITHIHGAKPSWRSALNTFHFDARAGVWLIASDDVSSARKK
jgi:hypothetical protein